MAIRFAGIERNRVFASHGWEPIMREMDYKPVSTLAVIALMAGIIGLPSHFGTLATTAMPARAWPFPALPSRFRRCCWRRTGTIIVTLRNRFLATFELTSKRRTLLAPPGWTITQASRSVSRAMSYQPLHLGPRGSFNYLQMVRAGNSKSALPWCCPLTGNTRTNPLRYLESSR